jgi:hypothetical protein
VERALTLWSSGDAKLVFESGESGKKVAKTSLRAINETTGRESGRAMSFGDANWGSSSRRYLYDLNDFREKTIDKLVQKALKYVKNNGQGSVASRSNDSEGMDNHRRIRDLSDDEDDNCNLLFHAM